MEEHRVVRTRVAVGPDLWVFGSGYLVGAERVLTAAHVLAPQGQRAGLGDACEVRVWPCGPAQDWLGGRITWLGRQADAALLAVEGLGVGLPPVQCGRLDGSEPVAWTAMGFPVAALDDADRREEEVFGRVAPFSGASVGELALTVESREGRGDGSGESPWAGLSGAAVFSGQALVGVVLSDPARWASSLSAVRITRLLAEPELAAGIGQVPETVLVSADLGHGSAASLPADVPTGGLRVVGERVSAGVETWRDRDRLRSELRAVLLGNSATHRILSVTGRRGIGKSATVAKVVAEFERPDPLRGPTEDLDGIVYSSTRTGVGALSLARVFEGLTRLLPDTTAAGLKRDWENAGADALPLLWEALRNRRCVVVLDNLDDLQDPGTGELIDPALVRFFESVARTPYPPRVITTSQRSLLLPAELAGQVREFQMEDGLGPSDAVDLLRAICGADVPLDQYSDEQLQQATARLFGVPRGIELLAQLLRTDPLALDDLLESDETLDGLMAQLVSRAFLALDTGGRHVVELLALAEVPLPELEIGQLLAELQEPRVTRGAVRALVRSREVGFDARSRALRLHPLDADWVRNEVLGGDPGIQVALDRRLADWYAGRRTSPETWRLLLDVLPHRLEYLHRWRCGDRLGAMRVLAEAADFLARKGESAVLTQAVAAADAVAGDDELRVHIERCRFAVEFFAGTLERAEAALGTARAAAGRAGLADAVDRLDAELGMVQRQRGACPEAAATLQTLLERSPGRRQRDVELHALLELGLTYCYLRDWDRADEVAGRLDALIAPGDDAFAAGPSDIWALARFGKGDYAGALAAADRGIALYLDSPRQDNAGYLYNVRALVHLATDRLADAEADLRHGLETAATYRVARLEAICATNLAWTLLRAGRCVEAAAAARSAETRLTAIGVDEAATARILAEVLAEPPSSPRSVSDRLTEAAQRSRANSDYYTPTPSALADMASALTGQEPVRAPSGV